MIKKDTKVAVLGAGAMGCLFGGLLAEKGLEVVLIDVWQEHVDEINKKGLKMMGHGGDRIVKIKATTEPKKLGKYDAIIIMCKATALENALSNAKNIIGDNTLLMSFQNGIGHEEIMHEAGSKTSLTTSSEQLARMVVSSGAIPVKRNSTYSQFEIVDPPEGKPSHFLPVITVEVP